MNRPASLPRRGNSASLPCAQAPPTVPDVAAADRAPPTIHVVDSAAPDPVQVRVPAKLNLHLGVGDRRADGFHELLTVFYAVSLYDTLTMWPAPAPSLTIAGEGAATLPTDSRNLVWRAVDLVARAYGRRGDVRIQLAKQIPVAAGLAGGSADAAAALVAANRLWGSACTDAQLSAMAASLGSDVPFALHGATAQGTGRGELLEPIRAGATLHWVLAVAPGELSTPAVYARFDELNPQPHPFEPVALVAALERGDAPAVGAALANDLQPAALRMAPALARTLAAGRTLGALGAVVSGSGPTCAFLAVDVAGATALAGALLDRGMCRLAHVVTGPVPGALTGIADAAAGAGWAG